MESKDMFYSELKNIESDLLPFTKTAPNEYQLKDWLDDKIFGVWIDDRKIYNEDLSRYHFSDLAYYNCYRLMKSDSKSVGYFFQVDLYTHEYFENVFIKRRVLQ